LTEAIAEEVRDTGVTVTCLCPGPTATEFSQVSGTTGSKLFKGKTMTSLDVARAGYEGWKRGDVLVVPGRSNRIGMLKVRLAPRAAVRRAVRRLNESVPSSGTE
jgi:short-subunit dehydrogenase